jgi:hypothetical protein
MANPFGATVPVRVTLRGLVVGRQRSEDAPPIGTLYPWSRLGPANFGSDGSWWDVCDENGRAVKVGKRELSLLVLWSRSRADALAAHARWLRQAWSRGTLDVVSCPELPGRSARFQLAGWVVFVGLAAWLLSTCGWPAWRILSNSSFPVDARILSVLALACLFCMFMWPCLLIFGVSLLGVWKPNVRRIRLECEGLRADLIDGQEVSASWDNVESIRRLGVSQMNFLRVRLATGETLWVLNPSGQIHAVIRLVLRRCWSEMLAGFERAKRRRRWRTGLYWAVAVLGMIGLCCWPESEIVDREILRATGMGLLGATFMLTTFGAVLHGYDKSWLREYRHKFGDRDSGDRLLLALKTPPSADDDADVPDQS